MIPNLVHLDRQDFLSEVWDYQAGEHVYFSEPTQQGKSFLAHQLLQHTLPTAESRFVSLMPKPRDPATSQWAPVLKLKVISDWPPPKPWPWQEKPAGHVLWPRHLKDATSEDNRAHVAGILRKAVRDQYWQGNSITFADDAHIAAVLMDLNKDFEEHLTAGGGMGSALWLANQKPSGTVSSGSLTSFAYSAPTHLFFGHDPDERNIKRFSEIGGVDPRMVADAVRGLRIFRIKTPHGIKNVSEKLYIHKGGPWAAVIGP